MFGAGRKTAELEQRINDYHAALQRIAQHVGVSGPQLPPDRLATAICVGWLAMSRRRLPHRAAKAAPSRPMSARSD